MPEQRPKNSTTQPPPRYFNLPVKVSIIVAIALLFIFSLGPFGPLLMGPPQLRLLFGYPWLPSVFLGILFVNNIVSLSYDFALIKKKWDGEKKEKKDLFACTIMELTGRSEWLIFMSLLGAALGWSLWDSLKGIDPLIGFSFILFTAAAFLGFACRMDHTKLNQGNGQPKSANKTELWGSYVALAASLLITIIILISGHTFLWDLSKLYPNWGHFPKISAIFWLIASCNYIVKAITGMIRLFSSEPPPLTPDPHWEYILGTVGFVLGAIVSGILFSSPALHPTTDIPLRILIALMTCSGCISLTSKIGRTIDETTNPGTTTRRGKIQISIKTTLDKIIEHPAWVYLARPTLIAGVFVMMGFGLFGASLGVGLASSGSFLLLPWGLGLPTFSFSLLALSVALIANLAFSWARPSASTTPSQTNPPVTATPTQTNRSLSSPHKTAIPFAFASTTLFIGFLTILLSILTGKIGPAGMAWSMSLAAASGFGAWLTANYYLKKSSGGPYATWAAIFGIALITSIGLACTASVGGFAVLVPALSSFTLPLVGISFLLLIPFIFFTHAGISYSRTLLIATPETTKATKIPAKEKSSYIAAEKTLTTFKVVLLIGFLFLAFLSIVTLFNLASLNGLGQLSGLMSTTFDLIVKMLGYNGFAIGTQWLDVFCISIFSAASFFAFTLTENILEGLPPDKTEDSAGERQKTISASISTLLKLTFSTVVILLMAMPSIFPANSIVSMLPVFLVIMVIMPLFSGRINSPFGESFNKEANTWFGLETLTEKSNGKNEVSRMLLREAGVVTILALTATIVAIAAGAPAFLAAPVLGIGVVTTLFVRWGKMEWKACEKDQEQSANRNLTGIALQAEYQKSFKPFASAASYRNTSTAQQDEERAGNHRWGSGPFGLRFLSSTPVHSLSSSQTSTGFIPYEYIL